MSLSKSFHSPLLSILAVFFACSGGADDVQEPNIVEVLKRQGPYGVGYTSQSISYKTPITNEDRTIQVLVWYPSNETEGDRPLYLVKSSEIAVQDAAPADVGARPVILFSHGHQAYPGVMSYLMEHWASHGYMVLAPGHTGNTLVNGSERETDIYYLRAHDLKAAYDHYLGLSDGPLKGLFSDQVIVTGHSFGAYTAFGFSGAGFAIDELAMECQTASSSSDFCSTLTPEKEALFRSGVKDDRMAAMMSFDPGNFDMYGQAGISQVEIPVLHVIAENGNHAHPDPSKDKFWNALSNPKDVRLLLNGGGHNDFVDSCGAGVDIRCSDLTPELVWSAMRVYTLAFIRRILEQDTAVERVLSGEAEVWSTMSVHLPDTRD